MSSRGAPAGLLVLAVAACQPPSHPAGPEGFEPDPTWDRLEIRFPDYAVPAERTTYACATTSFSMAEAADIVAFEPVIDNATVVHHMILGLVEAPLDGVVPCYPSAAGMIMQWGWAPGVGPLELPEEAGILVGNRPEGELHFVLQIHYDNAARRDGHVDRSGVNVYTTTELRPQRAGVLLVGDVSSVAIPAGQPDFESIFFCSSESTQLLLQQPVEVYGSWLHAHRLATALWTDQFRAGKKIGELGRHAPYDFDLQHVEPLSVTIQPGDALTTHCIYDSTDRTEPTRGGGGTEDEMCLNYLFYHPAPPVRFHCNDG